MPVDQSELAAYVDAQGQSQSTLTQLAVSAASQSAQAFTDWYDSAAIGAYATQLSQYIEAVQSQSASSTDAYLAAVAGLIKDKSVSPSGTINVSGLRKGVSHVEVYGRSADVYRYQKSLGKTDEEAQTMAVQRAEVMAETDSQLAMRAQSQKFMEVKNVTGYRRVIRPELSKTGTCGLCVAASTRFYSRGDLMPIHDRCKCVTMPIINSIDPGHLLNKDDLNALYEQAGGSTSGKALKKVRYTVHHNGEIGPVLGVHGQSFRSPADIAA